MQSGLDLAEYLSTGIERLMKDTLRASLKNPREAAFLLLAAARTKKAKRKRDSFEQTGTHIPAFLIASITQSCNLRCRGCYARHCDAHMGQELSAGSWAKIFSEAKDIGIAFVLLAGGEPLMRPDVLEQAARRKEIIFPVFTNSTLLSAKEARVFARHRNLVPVISIEGGRAETDDRRGEGAYVAALRAMDALHKRGVLFGTSITVTTQNIEEVTSDAFVNDLCGRGCRLFFYIEYVAVSEGTDYLAPSDRERELLDGRKAGLREKFKNAVFISFPGDEKLSGGCLAAGRGFFHINAYGSAEPCPFSPFSDTSAADSSLLQALQSPLFQKLKAYGLLEQAHDGGCVLFKKESEVRTLAGKTAK